MSIKDALKFEKSWVGDIWKGVKRDPKRLILGVDPISTKGWNAVLGRNDKSVVGDFGGPTKESYKNAQSKGIDTGTASTAHGIAKAIAAAWGGYGAANGLINGAASLGSTGAIGSGGGATGGVAGGAAGSAGGAVGAGAAEAIPEVVITGSSGGGLGTAAGAGAAGGATATSGNGNNSWRDQMQMPQQQDSSDQYAADQRRQLEAMMEQERIRREDFRRNAIARSLV